MLGKGGWPGLDRWFAAMDSRPSYLGMKSDFYTHCHDLPPQLGGCVFNKEGPALAAQVRHHRWSIYWVSE
jgi:glutathione S-transferase